eukprot:4705594-Prymnesium_polylepis.1
MTRRPSSCEKGRSARPPGGSDVRGCGDCDGGCDSVANVLGSYPPPWPRHLRFSGASSRVGESRPGARRPHGGRGPALGGGGCRNF